MTQFKPEGLARLLANVESAVLVKALELAELDHLLTTSAMKTIAKLGDQIEVSERISDVQLRPGKRGLGSRIRDILTGIAPRSDVVWDFWAEVFDSFDNVERKLKDLSATDSVVDVATIVLELNRIEENRVSIRIFATGLPNTVRRLRILSAAENMVVHIGRIRDTLAAAGPRAG